MVAHRPWDIDSRKCHLCGFQKLASSPKWDHHLYKSGCFVGVEEVQSSSERYSCFSLTRVIWPPIFLESKFNAVSLFPLCFLWESSRFLSDKHPVGLLLRSRCYDATRRLGDICEGARNFDKKKDRHMETSTHHSPENWQMDTKNDGSWKMYLGLENMMSFWVSMMDLTLCSAFQNSFGKLGARNLLCCFSWQSCTTKRRFETIFYFLPGFFGTWSNLTCAYL